MSIRQIIQSGPPPAKEEIVAHNGASYRLIGRADAATLAPALALNPEKSATVARHLSTVVGGAVDAEQVAQVMIVAQTLVDPDGPDESARYDQAEIAMLLVCDYPLFLKLLTAAYKVCGFVGESDDGANVLEAAAMGNSEASPNQD